MVKNNFPVYRVTMNESLLRYKKDCEEYKDENLQLKREITNERFEKVKAEETRRYVYCSLYLISLIQLYQVIRLILNINFMDNESQVIF